MAGHFSKIFWGLLVVILNISIDGFDLLVDGVGYLLVAAGCNGLRYYSPRFATARSLCLILAILWLVGFAIPGELAMVWTLTSRAVDCAMIWFLLAGIGEWALARQRPDLARRASNRRIAYVAIMATTTILGFALSGSRNAGPLAIVLVLSMLVLLVMILHLIHRAKIELVA